MTSLRLHPFRIFYSPADDPLNNFYIPALSASLAYYRSAGYFSSSALAVAAAGVARLIQNGGRMRLLVGADLNEQDVEAIRQGHDLKGLLSERMLAHFPDPQDALLRQRLEALAWMVAEGTLEIRVVLPTDEQGLPIPASQTQDYFHAKSGVFTDAEGNQIAFSGSVNESETAWKKNYENFHVFFSWDETKPHLAQVRIVFDRLWQGKEKDWIAVEIPQAVRQELLKYRPPEAPQRDPLETVAQPPPPEAPPSGPTPAEQIMFQYLRDAPYLPNAAGLGGATAAITPWPHQVRVADAASAAFPGRAMFCDEVGLGKTIEAGLVIRQLLLSGRVKRCLILTPKSVLKQWQEELYEKFNLSVPRYDGSKFWDVDDQQLANPGGNPWEAFPVLLAGSQLAKRSDRREQILGAQGWDLLVVDEAHHARRKDFLQPVYRPNCLLSLLSEINEQGKAAGLLLMTATPMQVSPLEVWDLLKLLGMGGRWGADEHNFLDFFSEMRKPFGEADWEFVYDLVQDYFATGGELEANFAAQVQADLGPVKWALLQEMPARRGQRAQTIKQLGSAAQSCVKELARLHTPLRQYIYRNTRSLLREYQKLGILKENVATRRPQIVRVEMRPEEYSLYERIEEYISQFYQKYEDERRGLGFVMTVYRRRLTSSFYAVRCSLERRLKFLRGEVAAGDEFDDDDTEQEELSQDISENILSQYDRARFQAELAYVRDFIHELKLLSVTDSKLERLKVELNQAFKQRSKALVFTQYADTMDYLRNQLIEVYGSEVACYSGRGGEVWNGIAWATTSKEQVKADFKTGSVRILLCTDSASEGLNLQTCGVLINYDMPWNPMRVEQRIGRIDRIGQEYKVVWVSNYFYQETIEDLIYQRLADRIDWFEVVVGDLQPILTEVGEVTRRLAMLPAKEREAQLEKEIEALKLRLQNRELESLNLDTFAVTGIYQPGRPSPVTLVDLEDILTRASQTAALFQPHPDLTDAYLLAWHGERLPVTFSAACFDEHPDTVRFLSYGSPLFDELLALVAPPDDAAASQVLRLATSGSELELRAWYFPASSGPALVETLAQLKAWLEDASHTSADLSDALGAQAEADFTRQVNEQTARQATVLQQRRLALALAEKAKAQRLLVKAALVELALGQQPAFLENETYPSAFNDAAIRGLQRHRYPWAPLLHLAYEDGLAVSTEDPYFKQIQGSNRESLKGRFFQLTEEAKKLVKSLSVAQKDESGADEKTGA